MKPVLVDTGPLYAMVDGDDSWHDRVSSFLDAVHAQLTVPITVLLEVCYLIATHLVPSVEVRFLESIQRGEVKVEFLKEENLAGIVAIMDKYADAGLDSWMPQSLRWQNDSKSANC